MSTPPPPPVEMQNAYAYGPPSRTSAAAIVSLVTGILGCLLITPIIAIVSGIIGIRATRDPAVRGRAMAVAGLILGLLWIFGAVATGAGVGVFLSNSERPAAAARAFTADVAAARYDAALANGSGLTEPQLRAAHDRIAGAGTVTDITLPMRNANRPIGGQTTWTLVGTITYSVGGTHAVQYTLRSTPAGGYVITKFDFK